MCFPAFGFDLAGAQWRKRTTVAKDTVSEWLRRWTRNPLGSARRGSNPLGVVLRLAGLFVATLCMSPGTVAATAKRAALLAQWLERAAVNRKVTGSIPVGSALFLCCFTGCVGWAEEPAVFVAIFFIFLKNEK